MYKESDAVNGEEMLCGAVDERYSKRNWREEDEGKVFTNVTLTPHQRIGRSLKEVQRWTNCFPNDHVTRRFNVAFYVDYGYTAVSFPLTFMLH